MTTKAQRHSGLNIGILGGGQLALMLADAAVRAGHRPLILAPSATEPAIAAGHDAVVGRLDDEDALNGFFAKLDLVTLENEFLDLPRIKSALLRHENLEFRPGLASLALAQDKLAQKQLFRRLAIPTADFEVVRLERLPDALGQLHRRFPAGFVLKWSRFGYDGRGNLVVSPKNPPSLSEIRGFCAAGRAAGATIYAERLVSFTSELAMVAARGGAGDLAFFPLVTTQQERGVCRSVLGPATKFGIDPSLPERAQNHLTALAQHLNFHGAFAVEFFLEGEDQLLINEMAPRVHNSGHGSLWRDDVSQFDLHVAAITDAPLAKPSTDGMIVMRNILGPVTLAGKTPSLAPIDSPPHNISLHWYGKLDAAPGRKMGHLTGRAANPEAAKELAAAMTAYEARYWQSVLPNETTNDDTQEHSPRRDHHGIEVRLSGHGGRRRGPE